MADKKQIRKIALQRRNDLPLKEREDRSKIICEKLIPYLKDKMIFSYYPFGSEVDISSINKTHKVAYPVISDNMQMKAMITKNNRFITNKFGIKEPNKDDAIIIDKKDIDVIIVPLVAFDENRNRIGYGGGYYDRYLEDYEGLKIGVAFSIQEFSSLDTDKNDVRLDIIITDTKIIS